MNSKRIFILFTVMILFTLNLSAKQSPGDIDAIEAQWKKSPHAGSMDTPEETKRMNKKGCAHCHTAQGYWREVLEGKPSAAPYPDVKGLTCTACHDKKYKLRAGKTENACTGCHDVMVQNDTVDFSSCPQGSFVQGRGGVAINNEAFTETGPHADIPGGCAGCHLAKAPKEISLRVGGHTFRVMTKNEKDPVMNTTACVNCHETNINMVRNRQAHVKKLLKKLGNLLPQRDAKKEKIQPLETPKFPKDPSLTKTQAKASFNYYQVLKDGTWGVHNPVYTKKLLNASIAALTKEK